MSAPAQFALLSAPSSDGIATVTGAELHHMRDVARLRQGSQVSLLGPDGVEYNGVIERFEKERAVLRVVARSESRPQSTMILAAAVIKGPRMDFLVEKAAELGAAELWPVMCARGVVRAPGAERIARWRRIALAAAKQTLSPAAMEVRAPINFSDLTRSIPKDRLAIICAAGAEPLASVIRRLGARSVLVACGPEGDFDATEGALAREAGFVAAGLGSRRLRSETAALAALSIAASALGELGGGN